MKAFIDTNVLIYAFTGDAKKKPRASDVIADGGIIGAQVLNEFTNVLRRKYMRSWAELDEAIAFLNRTFGPARPLTAALHADAVEIARNNGFAFYDALIIAAAAEASCDILYTEDMQHGQTIGGVMLRNPFL